MAQATGRVGGRGPTKVRRRGTYRVNIGRWGMRSGHNVRVTPLEQLSVGDVTANPVLAEVIRSGFVESRHRGTVVALAADGTFAFTAGIANAPGFPRSSNQPPQAAAVLRPGRPPGGGAPG